SYGKRPLADIKADVDRWLRLYPQVQGIFVDEQASAAGQVDYYAALYAYIRQDRRLRLVVSNPGTICAEGYLAQPAADVVCLFEAERGFEGPQPPAWAANYKPGRFADLAYKVGTADLMRKYVAEAVAKGIGQVYVTDGAGGNPWDHLPAWWEAEVAA